MNSGAERGPAGPSRWRQRRTCTLAGDVSAPASVRLISARGAFLETRGRPRPGERIELRHPEAGRITATVSAIALDGVAVAFEPDARAVAFALAVVAAEMSRPALTQAATHCERGMPCA